MNELEFTIKSSTIIGCFISTAVDLLLPFILCFIWKRKTSAKLFPVMVGIISYTFISFIRSAARMIILNDDLKQNKWLAYFILAVLAAVCEECGRYAVFRYIIPAYDNPKYSVCYGIGHGGLESFMSGLNGISFSGLMIGLSYLNNGINAFDTSTPEEIENTTAMLTNISGITFGYCIELVFISIFAMIFHIALSIIVFTAVNYAADGKKLLITAVLIHTVMNFTNALPRMNMTTETDSVLIDFFLTAALCYITYKVISNNKTEFSDIFNT